MAWAAVKEEFNINKKHSENAGTSTSVTFDIDVRPCTYVKVKKKSLCHKMSIIGTRFYVCECNSLRDMIISSLFVTFDLHL